jgi:hypothetical protein
MYRQKVFRKNFKKKKYICWLLKAIKEKRRSGSVSKLLIQKVTDQKNTEKMGEK